jgi:hypothetical protein
MERFLSLNTNECDDCLMWKWYNNKAPPSLHMLMFYRNIRRRGLLTAETGFDEDQMYQIVNIDLVQDVMGRQLKRYLKIWHKLVAEWYGNLTVEKADARALLLGRHWSLAVDHHTQDPAIIEQAVAHLYQVSCLSLSLLKECVPFEIHADTLHLCDLSALL